MEYQDMPTPKGNWTTMQTSIILTITLSGITLTTIQISAIQTTTSTGTVVKKTKMINKLKTTSLAGGFKVKSYLKHIIV